MVNPVTPVVLVFQRALYAKIDTGSSQPATGSGALQNVSNVVEILPNWSWIEYSRTSATPSALGIIFLGVGIYVFGRLEANFAEEL